MNFGKKKLYRVIYVNTTRIPVNFNMRLCRVDYVYGVFTCTSTCFYPLPSLSTPMTYLNLVSDKCTYVPLNCLRLEPSTNCKTPLTFPPPSNFFTLKGCPIRMFRGFKYWLNKFHFLFLSSDSTLSS